jgi:signal transduction histidine kinase
MRLLSSLRSRIFLASALLAVLSVGAAIYLVSVRVAGELERSLQRQIVASGALVDQLRASRVQTFTMMARLIADAPKLKAAVDTNDPPTVLPTLQDIADDYRDQLESSLLLVTNRDGRVLAAVGASGGTAVEVASQASVREAISGRESAALIPQPHGLLQLVSVPITIRLARLDILGALSVGFLLDDALAGQLKDITGSEIAFAIDRRVVASTLPADNRGVLAGRLHQPGRLANVTLGADTYLALPITLDTGRDAPNAGAPPLALILRSRGEQIRFLNEIHTELAVTAVMAVLLATLLSFTVARTITRPLAAITDVMREVAATGDLTRKIVLRGKGRWDDEDARLLAATFNTLTESVARFQREVSSKERLSSLGQLSTVIAHEVRNPLMIIKASLHALGRPGLSAADVRRVAADIDEEVARLNRIVNEVLDFARPIRFELAPADLNALCRESARAAEVEPGARVGLDLDPALPVIATDAERLRIALVNLIVNARQAFRSPEASAAGSGDADRPGVLIATVGAPDSVAIVISDSGTGIDRRTLPHIFDPYFTTKRGGTGLGLPIAKNIVEGLGGTISVTSAPDQGTQIRVHFPLAAAS